MTRAIAVGLAVIVSNHELNGVGPRFSGAAQDRQTLAGIIRGRVIAADVGRPLRRVRVSLQSAAQPVGQPIASVGTNTQGRFEFKNVAPGQYRVSATRAGFLTIQYGQRRPHETGTSIDIRDGDVVESVDLALPRGGVLAGLIVDELGEPYPDVRVDALEVRYNLGRRILFPAGAMSTNDGGRFRISGLQPGTYYVMASSRETWQSASKETFAYAPTYFPGVSRDTGAVQPIEIGVGQQRLDLDLRLTVSRAFRVSGFVRNAVGDGLAGATVMMMMAYRGSGAVAAQPFASARTGGDGSFEIRNVPPGDFRISTRSSQSDGQAGSASISLSLAGDVSDVVLSPRTGRTINGSIVTDDGALPPFPASRLRLRLIATDDERVLPTVRAPAVNADWSFRLTNVGGPFLFRVAGLPDGWMIRAVTLNGDEITDAAYDVLPGSAEMDMQIVVSPAASALNGDVVDAGGARTADATVVIFPDDENFWTPASRFIRMVRPDAGGHFTIKDLPAGTYRAIARDYIVEGRWEDREFLASVRDAAARIVLFERRAESVMLRLPPRP